MFKILNAYAIIDAIISIRFKKIRDILNRASSSNKYYLYYYLLFFTIVLLRTTFTY